MRFSSYAPWRAHAARLAACLRAANGSHAVVPRRNPAARLPTDFLLVQFAPADRHRVLGAVRRHAGVVGVHAQQSYARRAPLFAEPADAAPEEEPPPDRPWERQLQDILDGSSLWSDWAAAPRNASRRGLQGSSQDRGMAMKLNARVLCAAPPPLPPLPTPCLTLRYAATPRATKARACAWR